MSKFGHFVIKTGMLDKFGYTFVHATIDFALLTAAIAVTLKLILSLIF
jgi:hypothetical protein